MLSLPVRNFYGHELHFRWFSFANESLAKGHQEMNHSRKLLEI